MGGTWLTVVGWSALILGVLVVGGCIGVLGLGMAHAAGKADDDLEEWEREWGKHK